MAVMRTSKYLGIIIFCIFLSVSCERTKDKMYKTVNGTFCYKRLNGTAEFGCTSSRSGDTGVVHIIRNETDINWLIKNANAGPYIIVVTFKYFNRKLILKLKNSGKISGIVLTNVNETTISKYSPDDSCPNRNSGLDGHCDSNNPWNPAGDSLLFENLGFPVIFVNSKETIDFIENCFETHNSHDLDEQNTRSLCSIEIVSHNIAAVDTQTCMRRKMMASNLMQLRYCDPLGDRNIFLPLLPRTKPENNRSVILVAARLDGLSMFDGDVPGAKSPVSGIVSLLTTAYYLHKMTKSNPDQTTPDGNIIFLLINGESFDYIGSSRIIYEIQNNIFPYKPVPDIPEEKQSPPLQMNSIGLIVELDEIIDSSLFYHTNVKENSVGDKRDTFLEYLKKESSNLQLSLGNSIANLPPASVQRFIKEDPKIQGIVLSSYNETYNNQYYHSILDKADKFYNYTAYQEDDKVQSIIARASLAVAKSLYKLLFGVENSLNVAADMKLVNELLHCYLENASCSIFQRVTFNEKLVETPLPLYVSVYRNYNIITNLSALTLAMLTGERNNSFNETTCHRDEDDMNYKRFWMASENDKNVGVCIVSLVNFTAAVSPAFDIEDYNWTSNQYSTWTESIWQGLSARVFLKPSKHHEIATLSLGLVVLIFSFAVVYFINVKANILFNHQVLGSGGC